MLEAMKRMALQASVRTGLKEDTCLDLILSGWVFHQEAGSPDMWMSPSVSLPLPRV